MQRYGSATDDLIEDQTNVAVGSYAAGSSGSGTGWSYVVAFAPSGSVGSGGSGSSDTTPPTTSITAPTTGATISGTTSVTASASDNVGVVKVEFYLDNVLQSTDTTFPYTWSWNTTSASNGSHSLQTKAYDAAGNVGTSNSVSVTVQNGTGASGNIYVSQNGAGTSLGTDCANAYPVTWFNTAANWGTGVTQIGPGTTVHLCGTFTGTAGGTMLRVQGSGASGNPVTILFEPGAVLTAPYWLNGGSGLGGAINTLNANYITIDGGTNGVIQNTGDGSSLTYHEATQAIVIGNCNYCEVKNLTISNLYVKTGTQCDETLNPNFEKGALNAIVIGVNSSHITVDNNTIHDTGWAIVSNGSYVTIGPNNNIYNIDHGFTFGAPDGYTISGIVFEGNHVHDYAVWDTGTADCYHHDGIHGFGGSVSGVVTDFTAYNNIFDGNTGQNFNQHIFLEGTAVGTPWTTSPNSVNYIYNNVFYAPTPSEAITGLGGIGGNGVFANNTIIGANPTYTSACEGFGGTSSLSPGAYVENNAVEGCGVLVSGSGNFKVATFDYNAYANCNNYNCWFTSFTGLPDIDVSSFSTWQGQSGYDAHSISNIGSATYFGLNGYQPLAGSPLIGAGTNLTFLCSQSSLLAPLCKDISGTPRPTTGAWDIGAYYVGGGSGSGSSDTTPPVTSITAPTSGSTVSGTTSVSASASDNVGVTKVEFYLDNVLQTTDTASPYTWSWNTTGASNGTHSLQTKAYDAAGNVGTSNSVSVTVSNVTAASGNIYIAQTAQGAGNGTNCANAYAVSFFNTASNWGTGATQIGPGTTVHVCGTVSTALSAQGSGSSGSPVTVLWESGARVSLPVCSSSGCVNIANRSYIVLDGGSTCGWVNGALVSCNGTVEATQSGSAYGNGGTSSFGIVADDCGNCEIRNLNVANIYQHTSSSDSPAGDFRGIQNIGGAGNGTTYSVHNNIVHDAASGIVYVPGPNDNGFKVYNNYEYNINSSVDISNNNNGTLTAASIHDNHFGSTANWDATGCPGHHNSLHAFAYPGTNGGTNSGIDYYNNLIDGNWGTCSTGGLFIEGNGSVNNNVRIFNNLWLISGYTQMNNGIVNVTAGGNVRFYNNTIVALHTSDNCLAVSGLPGAAIYIENNIVSNCGTDFITNTTNLFSTVDYNVYDGPSNDPWTDQSIPQWYPTLASWQSHCNCDLHSVYSSSTAWMNLNSSGVPQIGSPAIGIGANLTSLGITTLNMDYTSTPRPTTGPWDIGAYQVSSGGGSDTTPPTTSITSPTSGSMVSSTISVSASALDNVGVVKVEFYLDNVLQAADTTSPYTWSWNTASTANGSHSLQTKAYDAAGNIGISPSVTVTVSNAVTPPPQTLQASLSAFPSSGNAPLTVSLVGTASGNQVGTLNFTFYCNNNDATTSIQAGYVLKVNGTSTNPLTASNLCTFSSPGTYSPKVIIEQGTGVDEARGTVTVTQAASGGGSSGGGSSGGGGGGSSSGGGGGGGSVGYTPTPTPPPVSSGSASGYGSGGSGSFTISLQVTTTTQTTAQVKVMTSLPAVTQLFYGTVPTYGSTTSQSPSLTTSYFNLTNLYAKTPYYLKAVSLQNGQTIAATTTFTPGYGGTLPTTGSSLPPFTRNLTVGSEGQDVMNLQTLLNQQGFTITATGPGSPNHETTYFGSLTTKAVQRFQQANHIAPVSGFVGPLTRAVLNTMLNTVQGSGPAASASAGTTNTAGIGTITRTLTQGDQGDDVTRLQQFLQDQGYLPVAPTGYFGILTLHAVQAYQCAENIVCAGSPDATGYGLVGPRTRGRMGE